MPRDMRLSSVGNNDDFGDWNVIRMNYIGGTKACYLFPVVVISSYLNILI